MELTFEGVVFVVLGYALAGVFDEILLLFSAHRFVVL